MIMEYKERKYRNRINVKDLISFNVIVKETDLWVSAEKEFIAETRNLVFDCRHQLESYIGTHPEFLTTLSSYPDDLFAPRIVKMMIHSTQGLGVGPMASVAGAIAQNVGTGLLKLTGQVIVENGGDIFMKADRDITISVFAGTSPFSEKIGILIKARQMPLGICSSSGTVGHSLSKGIADAICIVSSSAVLADGAATALGNRIKTKKNLDKVAGWAGEIEGIIGGMAIVKDRIAVWGDIEVIRL